MSERRTIGWFSCGRSSLVACRLARPDEVIYIHVANQHPDTLRFLMDARVLLGRPIISTKTAGGRHI